MVHVRTYMYISYNTIYIYIIIDLDVCCRGSSRTLFRLFPGCLTHVSIVVQISEHVCQIVGLILGEKHRLLPIIFLNAAEIKKKDTICDCCITTSILISIQGVHHPVENYKWLYDSLETSSTETTWVQLLLQGGPYGPL